MWPLPHTRLKLHKRANVYACHTTALYIIQLVLVTVPAMELIMRNIDYDATVPDSVNVLHRVARDTYGGRAQVVGPVIR